MPRSAKPATPSLTAAQREQIRQLRQEIGREKTEILAEARKHKAAHDSSASELRRAFELLKAERILQQLSLSDMQERTGIGRSALSRLENDPNANPTVTTLTRYAEALGKKLVLQLADGA
jgi:DNA-binding phage protein